MTLKTEPMHPLVAKDVKLTRCQSNHDLCVNQADKWRLRLQKIDFSNDANQGSVPLRLLDDSCACYLWIAHISTLKSLLFV